MTRLTLLRCTALLLATGACAGRVADPGTTPDRAMRHALVARYGEPNVLWVSSAAVRIEYSTRQYEAVLDPKASPDSADRSRQAFGTLARSIASTAVTGAGPSAPAVVEVVLHERRLPGGSLAGSPNTAYTEWDHAYSFRATELASR